MSRDQFPSMPPRMLHLSSGRQNFDLVKVENNSPSVSSQQNLSSSSANIIQRQTDEAIKAALHNNKQANQSFIGQHMNITCDGCSKTPIIGDRYKCMVCPNIDFCSDCQSLTTDQHDSKHPLICIRDSNLYASSIYMQNMSQLIHRNTSCRYCSVAPIVGVRYQCVQCGINLCQQCEFLCLHDISHKLLRIIYPE